MSAISSAVVVRSKRIVVHWFRHGDLRLHDNPALTRSSMIAKGTKRIRSCAVVPIFCFDSNIFGATALTPSGSLKCGPRRAKFIVESVTDLRHQLHSQLGTQLLVAHGEPAQIFDQLLTQLNDQRANIDRQAEFVSFRYQDINIVCQDEVAREEREAMEEVSVVLRRHCSYRSGKQVEAIWGSTLYSPKGMPFQKTFRDMPDLCRDFTGKVRRKHKIDKPIHPVPDYLPFPKHFQTDLTTYIPTLKDLGYNDEQIQSAESVDPRGAMEFVGGETAALARVQHFIFGTNLRQGVSMIGAYYSTKFSPWLAHGCLSPRHVIMETKRYTVVNGAPYKATNLMINDLLKRDFCKFFTVKHGDAIFRFNGPVLPRIRNRKKLPSLPKAKPLASAEANAKFEAWKEGRTGYPLVDANMRELNGTGYMSSRGRLIVASFLVIDLAHDWQCGGDWFESQLIDYDVYSNWVVSASSSALCFNLLRMI